MVDLNNTKLLMTIANTCGRATSDMNSSDDSDWWCCGCGHGNMWQNCYCRTCEHAICETCTALWRRKQQYWNDADMSCEDLHDVHLNKKPPATQDLTRLLTGISGQTANKEYLRKRSNGRESVEKRDNTAWDREESET